MNAITLTGNIVADPEVVKYGDDRKLVNFRLANNEMVNGESVSNGFYDVTVFGPSGEHVVNSLKKGERIVVTGRMQHSTYEREDGTRGGRTKLIAQEIGMSLLFEGAKRRKSE